MLNDLSALAPPFVVCAAFLFAVGAFLRHEMAAKRRRDDRDASADISGDGRIPDRDDRDASGGREVPGAAGEFDRDRA